jgi:hypothetical protein
MKKHLTTYAFIAALVMGFTASAFAEECSANIKKGTCSHQNGKNKHDCEDIWEYGGQWTGDGYKVGPRYYHCKWIPGLTQSTSTCSGTGLVCNDSKNQAKTPTVK